MMSLTIGGGGDGGGARTLHFRRCFACPFLLPPSTSSSWTSNLSFWSVRKNSNSNIIVAKAGKKLSSRTGKFDSKNRRSLTKIKEEEKEDEQQQERRVVQIETDEDTSSSGTVDAVDDDYVLPDLPGEKPDFWEGPQWDTLGFVVQYLWAFGIVFALIACGIAVATYNEGATDFKQTPVYKESVQSRELLEEPEGSSSDVFESNPTEEAPSLE
ncbi:hypothetical protein NMG60_11033612 [Bertholletia excelsa]